MPEEDSLWSSRIKMANREYDEWESLFKCAILEKYYEGFQWKNVEAAETPYTVNFFSSTIKEKIAAHLFAKPQFKITPKPGFSDYDLGAAIQSAQLKEDTLNTIISDDNNNFEEEIELAYIDSFFRFAVLEVGYAADFVINPNAGRPLLRSWKKLNVTESEDRILKHPDELPQNERIFFKRIPPERFRVGGIDSSYLNHCDWFGYWDYIYRTDLFSLKGLKNTDKIDQTFPGYSGIGSNKPEDQADKIWHIWSTREKKRFLFLDNNMIELWSQSFSRIPMFIYRPDRRTKGFYPIPVAFSWVSPQNEINDARQQLKNHRKRFNRKFQALEGMIDDLEVDKFENGPDGAVIKVKQRDALTAIETASLGQESDKSVLIAKDDFNVVSGTSTEMRGVADRMTATQSKFIEGHSNRRESKEDSSVSKWICRIGREVLLIAREQFTEGMWIRLNTDPSEEFLSEIQDQKGVYNFVTTEDLDDGVDFKVDVDITSMAPDRFDQEKTHFVEFLSIVASFPAISLSPMLIREAAYRCNYRNERIIKEMQKSAMLVLMGKVNEAQNSNAEGQIAQTRVAQMRPGTQEQVQNQIDQQLITQ